jgi:hypothetical protein
MSEAQKIFCIGLGKTGTKTLADVLKKSGRKHSTGPVKEGLFWYRSEQLKKLKKITESFDSFDDYPYPLIYQHLHREYPQALFVLTTRRTSSDWADSVIDHHMRFGPSDAQLMTFGFYPLARDREWLCDFYEKHKKGTIDYFGSNDNFVVIDWEDSTTIDAFLKRARLNTNAHQISAKNTKNDQDAQRVVLKHLANKCPGAALMYAKQHPNSKQLMSIIARYGDQPIRSKVLKALHKRRKP